MMEYVMAIIAGFLGLVALIAAAILLQAWVLMLLLGAIAHIFDWPNLLLGFWQTVPIVLILGLIGAIFRGGK